MMVLLTGMIWTLLSGQLLLRIIEAFMDRKMMKDWHLLLEAVDVAAKCAAMDDPIGETNFLECSPIYFLLIVTIGVE